MLPFLKTHPTHISSLLLILGDIERKFLLYHERADISFKGSGVVSIHV